LLFKGTIFKLFRKNLEINMATVGFFEPKYVVPPQSLTERATNWVEGYFDLTQSAFATMLKVISYATVIIPIIMLIAKIAIRFSETLPMPHLVPFESSDSPIKAAIDKTPEFAGYAIGQGTPYAGATLTSATVRPSNLLFDALFGPNSTTLPGSGQLFAFNTAQGAIRNQLDARNGDEIISVNAAGKAGQIYSRATGGRVDIPDLADLYGPATCRFSINEIREILRSQRISLAPLLPRQFYMALKNAMLLDGIVTLPGNDGAPIKVSELRTPYCRALIENAQDNPRDFGFVSRADCDRLLELSLYQLGSLAVKAEDFHILIDSNGKIRERNPGDRDSIRLINACGIRGIHRTPSPLNKTIMTQAFQTALHSAESGYVIVPAVGMGVWGGDPDLYWRAFLDAVEAGGAPLEQIFVNPGHQTTRTGGPYNGHNGNEFQIILDEYRARAAQSGNAAAAANLGKIVNLFDKKTDIVHLSQNLKAAFPDKIISLVNASDPDVTLGNHVGEYVNNLDHPATTEENYTALGTNGLCFEGITQVHQDPGRVIQI
jgi:hypothetical protein